MESFFRYNSEIDDNQCMLFSSHLVRLRPSPLYVQGKTYSKFASLIVLVYTIKIVSDDPTYNVSTNMTKIENRYRMQMILLPYIKMAMD